MGVDSATSKNAGKLLAEPLRGRHDPAEYADGICVVNGLADRWAIFR